MLNGKVAIITGSTSGIGLGIARALALEGCRVALNGRRTGDEVERLRREMWDKVLATNLSSAFHCTKAVLPAMRARKWGRIINIASAHGLVASPFKAAYVAGKHGMLGLTKVTALETAEQGVTCNAICPGYVWTPLVAKQIDDQARAHGIPRDEVIREVILAPQPTKQFVTVEEVAALAVFLASNAARSITGAVLPIDGGWTAR